MSSVGPISATHLELLATDVQEGAADIASRVTATYFGWRAGCFNRRIGALDTWIMHRAQIKLEPGLEWSRYG